MTYARKVETRLAAARRHAARLERDHRHDLTPHPAVAFARLEVMRLERLLETAPRLERLHKTRDPRVGPCRYCGKPTRRAGRACRYCADLPDLDDA